MAYKSVAPVKGVVLYPDTADVGADHRGWLVGSYIQGMLPGVPFEVKDGHHVPGDSRTEWAKPREGFTFALVLAGSTTITWLQDDGSEVPQEFKAGMSFIQDDMIPHKWTVGPEGVHIITVRTR